MKPPTSPGSIFLALALLASATVSTPISAQQPAAVRPPNTPIFDPADVYYQGYLFMRDAEALEAKGKFPEALAKFRSAEKFFRTVSQYHPEWKPTMVVDRTSIIEKRIKEVLPKAQEEMNKDNIAAAELEGGTIMPAAPSTNNGNIQTPDPRLKNLEEEINRLRAALASPANQESRQAARASDLEKQRNDLNARLSQALRELDTLRNKLASQPVQSELDALNHRIRSIEQERQAMKYALDQSSERHLKSQATIQSLSADLRAAAQEISNLRNLNKIQTEKNSQIVKGQLGQIQQLEGKLKDKEIELTKANNTIDSLNRQLQESKDAFAELQTERDSLMRERDQLSALLKLSEEGRMQQLIEQNMTLAKDLREARERVEQLNKNTFESNDQLTEALRDLAIAKSKILDFQTEKRKQEEHIRNLEIQLEADGKSLAQGKGAINDEEAETLRGIVNRQLKQLDRSKQAAALLMEAAKQKVGASSDYDSALTLLTEDEFQLTPQEEQALTQRRIDGEIFSPYANSRDSVDRNMGALKEQVGSYGNAAKRAFLSQRFSASREIFEMMLDLNPGNIDTMRKLGITHLRLDDPVAATQIFRSAVENDESQPLSHRYYGLSLYKQGALAEAKEAIERCLEIDPQDSQALTIYGNTLQRQGAAAEAEAAYKNAIALNPSNHEAHHNLAVLYSRTKRIKDAIAAYHESLKHGGVTNPNLESLK